MSRPHCPSRPESIEELVRRRLDPACDTKEKVALDALIESMVERFRNHKLSSDYSQVALLAPKATDVQYNHLLRVISDSIITNSKKGSALDSDLLPSLIRVLRSHPGDRPQDSLFATINSLRQRLEVANKANDLNVQYVLAQAMCHMLDVAVDTKVSEIDHDEFHNPLLSLLGKIQKHDEPRLAQAAAYAREALRGVSDNQGPWDIFLNTSGTILSVAAKTAGAVSTMNPDKLVEAAPDIFDLLETFKKIYEAGETMKANMEAIKAEFDDSIRSLPGQNPWYGVLRYTGMLIDTGPCSFGTLRCILPKIPCGNKWQFWCGLYAQLEQSYLQMDEAGKSGIVDLVNWTFKLPALQDTKKRTPQVKQWITLIAKTLNQQSEWQDEPKKRHKISSLFSAREDFEPRLLKPLDPVPRAMNGQLLDETWEECKKAQLFYAGAALTRYYAQGNVLQILRLSGEPLDIGHCYINLGIVEATLGQQTQRVWDPSLSKRLAVEAPSDGGNVQLEDLYKHREQQTHGKHSKSTGTPRRVLIRGRAGVGKTTLCKKIVHEFVHGKLQSWNYDRLIWIPLRKLKDMPDSKQFLEKEIWSKHPDKRNFVRILLESIMDDKHGKTLLLLDGFDEIVAHQTAGGDFVKYQPVLDLLNHRDIILTSRPHASLHNEIHEFDLELETVGFRSDQVDMYLDTVVGVHDDDPQSARDIRSFINSHWLMKGLFKIPIQLDALCYTWNEKFFSADVRTMTGLYQAIELKLWKRDALLQSKMSEAEAKNISLRQHVEVHMSDCIDLVQNLAFCGFCSNTVEFSGENRMLMYRLLPGMATKSDNLLANVSFLRSTESSQGQPQTYYFMHLTFQEFFAAHYFVQCWTHDEKLKWVDMNSNEYKELDTHEFVQHEKYNGRYNMMWRFVAGLLYNHRPMNKLTLFMQTLDSTPLDLLKSTHLRILMHCFSEVSGPRDPDLTEISENMNKQLLLGLLHMTRGTIESPEELKIAREMEFPAHLFEKVLREGNGMQRCAALKALSGHAQLSPKVRSAVTELLDFGEDYPGAKKCTDRALDVIGSHADEFPGVIIDLLKSDQKEKRLGMVRYIGGRFGGRFLPGGVIAALLGQFRDFAINNTDIGSRLEGQAHLSGKSISILESFLEDSEDKVRRQSLVALSGHISANTSSSLDKMLKLRNDSSHEVRRELARVLAKVKRPELLPVLLTSLDDSDDLVRGYAADGLVMLEVASPEVIDALIPSLKIFPYRWKGWETSSAYAKLYERMRKSNDSRVHLIHLEYSTSLNGGLFRSDCTPSEEDLRHLKARATGSHLDLFRTLRAFRNRTDLHEEVLRWLILFLRQEEMMLQGEVAQIFAQQSELPEAVVHALSSLVSDKRTSKQALRASLRALGNVATLPEDVLPRVARLMHNPATNFWASNCLQQQTNLPPTVFEALIDGLKSQYRYLRPKRVWEKILIQHDAFYKTLPDVDLVIWKSLFKIWFDRSLDENMSCVLWEDSLHITMPEGLHKIEFKTPLQKENLARAIETLQDVVLTAQSQRGENKKGDFYPWLSLVIWRCLPFLILTLALTFLSYT